MLYTIGLSFSAELLVKGLYENTLGRVFEWIGGWDSADDRYATKVQKALRRLHARDALVRIPLRRRLFDGLWSTTSPTHSFAIGNGASRSAENMASRPAMPR